MYQLGSGTESGKDRLTNIIQTARITAYKSWCGDLIIAFSRLIKTSLTSKKSKNSITKSPQRAPSFTLAPYIRGSAHR